MLSLDEYDKYCATLPHANMVVQWGDSHVWKVDTKVFAVGGWGDGSLAYFTFKVSPQSYDIMKEQPGLRPAPYLASRGMKWIQMTGNETLSDEELELYLKESYRLASLNLTKKRQKELGLNQPE